MDAHLHMTIFNGLTYALWIKNSNIISMCDVQQDRISVDALRGPLYSHVVNTHKTNKQTNQKKKCLQVSKTVLWTDLEMHIDLALAIWE